MNLSKTVTATISILLISLLLCSCGSDSTVSPSGTQEITIGALLSLTGDWSSSGEGSKASLEIALNEVNTYLSQIGSSLKFKLIIEDTKLDPATALEKLKSLEQKGVKIIIGPQSSAEVNAIKSYCDTKGIIIISQSSTAHSLAVSGDNLFRFCPDDLQEGTAVATLMKQEGINAVVPMWRDDTGNNGLSSSMKIKFEALGGKVYDGVKYSSETTDFTLDLQNLNSQISQAKSQYGNSSVAVYLAAFEEVVYIFNKAKSDTVISSVKWYGSDGVAQNNNLLSDAGASQFAVTAGYPNPNFGLDDGASDKWKPLSEQIKAKIGREPDTFAFASYDAFWVACKSYMSAGTSASTSSLKNAIIQTSDSYYGATGWTKLNDAGDRNYGIFDFWSIRNTGGTLQWKKTAIFTAKGTIVYIQ